MSVNPFHWQCTYIDADGCWEVIERNISTREVLLRDPLDHSRYKRIDLDTLYDLQMRRSIPTGPLSRQLGRRRTLDQRWYSRMLRMKQKKAERTLRRAAAVGEVLVWVWGVALIVVITSKVWGWAMQSVLG